jgi:glycosyltransferase involved in cell wall biosynthesis
LVVAGEGPEQGDLERLSRQLGARLRLLGQLEPTAVAAWMRAASVVAVPSRAEGMSNVLLEALALGCPVVASAIPGNVELVEHGATGLSVPVDDPVRLRQSIDQLVDSPQLAQRLGEAARQRVGIDYGIDVVASKYEALYQRLVEGNRCSSRAPRG